MFWRTSSRLYITGQSHVLLDRTAVCSGVYGRCGAVYLSDLANQHFALLFEVGFLSRRLCAIRSRGTIRRHFWSIAVECLQCRNALHVRSGVKHAPTPRAKSPSIKFRSLLELSSSIDHRDETTQVKVSQSLQSQSPGTSPRFND